MEFRIEKRAGAVLAAVLLSPALLADSSFRYDAWHPHSRPPHIRKAGEFGTLMINDAGVSFQAANEEGKAPKHPEAWHWDYPDIQQLKMSPKSLSVLTYKDNKWKLGADREYEFNLVSEQTFEDAYQFLKIRLDQRFVAVIADRPHTVLWDLPVKHLLRLGGDEGILQVGAAEIVYKSAKKDETRTWRYQDIENISSSGPFQLTITTFERSRLDYGSLKAFNFQLKQRLDEARYNDLWLRLNQSKGLAILDSYRSEAVQPVK